MSTLLYLVRHGATVANLACPSRLQGRRHNPPLTPPDVLQAEAARDRLAAVPLHRCCCSPLLRAAQTAAVMAAPHGLFAEPVETLGECDVGRWEGLDWQTIRDRDADAHISSSETRQRTATLTANPWPTSTAAPSPLWRPCSADTPANRSWWSHTRSFCASIWRLCSACR